MSVTASERSVGEPDQELAPRGLWLLVGISGVVNLVIGVLVLAYPDPSIKLLGIFLGIDLLVVGGTCLVAGAARGTIAIVVGVLALIAGLIVIRNPAESLLLLTLVFATYLIAAGALSVGRAFTHHDHRAPILIRGTLLIIAGTVIFAWPDLSLTTLAVLTGLSLLIHGAADIGEAFVLRKEPIAGGGL